MGQILDIYINIISSRHWNCTRFFINIIYICLGNDSIKQVVIYNKLFFKIFLVTISFILDIDLQFILYSIIISKPYSSVLLITYSNFTSFLSINPYKFVMQNLICQFPFISFKYPLFIITLFLLQFNVLFYNMLVLLLILFSFSFLFIFIIKLFLLILLCSYSHILLQLYQQIFLL